MLVFGKAFFVDVNMGVGVRMRFLSDFGEVAGGVLGGVGEEG